MESIKIDKEDAPLFAKLRKLISLIVSYYNNLNNLGSIKGYRHSAIYRLAQDSCGRGTKYGKVFRFRINCRP